MSYLKPSAKGRRDVLDNSRDNGRVVNPPRMAKLGGLSSTKGRGLSKNEMSIRKPGQSTK